MPASGPHPPDPAPKDEKAPEKGADKKGAKKEAKAPAPKPVENFGPDFRYIVRMADTDLDGRKSVELALSIVRGIGIRTADVIADHAGVPTRVRIGSLTEPQLESLVTSMNDLRNYAPEWLLNRREDWASGETLHLVGNDIPTFLRDDINRMKKIRSYRGVRHEKGKKVRGQRTKSNGRKGLAIGVIKKVEGGPGAAPAAEEKGKEKK